MKNWFLLAPSDTGRRRKILLSPGSYKFIASRPVGIGYQGYRRFAIGRMGFAFSSQDSRPYFGRALHEHHYGPAVLIRSLVCTKKKRIIYLG